MEEEQRRQQLARELDEKHRTDNNQSDYHRKLEQLQMLQQQQLLLQKHQQFGGQPRRQHLHQAALDQNNALVYDRSIKCAKTNFADHGSHGVAALPLPVGQQQQQQLQPGLQDYQPGLSKGGVVQMGVPSSVQMQLQMQLQMRLLQQQHQAEQMNAQSQEYGVMPPPMMPAQTAYPSLVPGSLGAQQLHMAGQPFQDTSLLDASRVRSSQVTAANPHLVNSVSVETMNQLAGQTLLHPNLGNLATANSQLGLLVSGLEQQQQQHALAPGDVINGKKRVSPSMPLHPSQLQLPIGYVQGLGSVGMVSVTEEGELAVASQTLQAHPAPAVSGLLGTALDSTDSVPQCAGGLNDSNKARPQSEKITPEMAEYPTDKRGEVLTNPSVPAANNGQDNSEGNLIVCRGDVLKILSKNLHVHPPTQGADKVKDETGCVEYKVVSLLGQGTFAQVFHCTEIKSNKSVAVKIVKNKPAYTRQAAVEIDVFRKLYDKQEDKTDEGHANGNSSGPERKDESSSTTSDSESIIRLMHYFMFSHHLCLVFEMLGPNLYELLKKRQFRGLPIGAVRSLVRQATEGIKLLGKRKVVHCDLKPENILMVRTDVDVVIQECKAKGDDSANRTATDKDDDDQTKDERPSTEEQLIKLIDFGSACFEGQTTHTYIQSRFYRSPEVLVGLPYDSAIDIWSLGCVAAELFLGLPILPGVHEHDQLGRILEMIGDVPDWMLEQGSKTAKFFKTASGRSSGRSDVVSSQFGDSIEDASVKKHSGFEFKTRKEYINALTEEECRNKGGLAKLEQQQTNRYFKKIKLEDIVMHHGVCNTKNEREQLGLFVHFLKGVLDPDPWKRWTAHQASMHPFLTGSSAYRVKTASGEVGADGTRAGAKPYEIYWKPPWDASIPRRKMLAVQKSKEKQAKILRRNSNSLAESLKTPYRGTISQSVPEMGAIPAMAPLSQGYDIYGSPLRTSRKILDPHSPAMSVQSAVSVTAQLGAMADAMSLGMQQQQQQQQATMGGQASSPPQSLFNNHGQLYANPALLSASLGGAVAGGMPMSYQQYAGLPPAAQHYHVSAAPQQLQHMAVIPQAPPPSTYVGAQSFSGAYYDGVPGGYMHPHIESDLGYALQRPGVVPGGLGGNGSLRRNSSKLSLSQQAQLLSGSLGNLASTPRGYGIQYQTTVPMSPGGALLQQLGLHEQILLSHSHHSNLGTSVESSSSGGSGGGTSLLTQQLQMAEADGQRERSQTQLNVYQPQHYQGQLQPGSYSSSASLEQHHFSSTSRSKKKH